VHLGSKKKKKEIVQKRRVARALYVSQAGQGERGRLLSSLEAPPHAKEGLRKDNQGGYVSGDRSWNRKGEPLCKKISKKLTNTEILEGGRMSKMSITKEIGGGERKKAAGKSNLTNHRTDLENKFSSPADCVNTDDLRQISSERF